MSSNSSESEEDYSSTDDEENIINPKVEKYSLPTPKKEPEWDFAKDYESEIGSASEQNTTLIKKATVVLKIVTMIITFSAVLSLGLVSMGSTLLMVSQISREDLILHKCSNDNNYIPIVRFRSIYSIAWLWCIFFSFMVSELFTFLKSLKYVIMRTVGRPVYKSTYVMVFTMETLHVVGLTSLFYIGLPYLDSMRAIMTFNGLFILPSILLLIHQKGNFNVKAPLTIIKLVINIVACGIQGFGLCYWLIVDSSIKNSWIYPFSLILISCGWWESFVSENKALIPVISKFLTKCKNDMIYHNARYFLYVWVSLWKILVFLALFITFSVIMKNVDNVNHLFDKFKTSFSSLLYFYEDDLIKLSNTVPAKVLITQIISGFFCYIFAKFACSVNIQRFCFVLPLQLVSGLGFIIMTYLCAHHSRDPCIYKGDLPVNLFFKYPSKEDDIWYWLWGRGGGWFAPFWFFSQLWITLHTWFPKSQKLARTEEMFGTPFYNSLTLVQSILSNRRSDNGKIDFWKANLIENDDHNLTTGEITNSRTKIAMQKRQRELIISGSWTSSKDLRSINSDVDEITRIKGCATMWHESEEEITEMLKSLFRIDEDHFARRYAKHKLNVPVTDYYEWETHIFFDDAMEPNDEGTKFQVNSFVRLLIQTVDEQGKKWYGSKGMKVGWPEKFATPYGGRLIWTLPGKTKIICHLKDKNKIRHKKRWSQVMYMYYFLGYQLKSNPKLTKEAIEKRSWNTYLLALDGDVDFQPDAILKLVDLMKRNPYLGASCGRIHPTGSGFMQWYQKFEYAIGHWLQKATEHVMGCVLCSPGCFSLFRAKAIMDDNVMKAYTKVASEPKHFVQYDQGEDRWLCTLLLQQGWRVEYSAASDSFTACPETFKEFYNQRRRWMPSTIANIMDLLRDYRRVIRNNDNISIMYIIYQVMMMVGTILGPGSIFLMLVGSFGVAFNIYGWAAFLFNFVPVAILITACLVAKSDNQILIAQILSIFYALLMMSVLVGILVQLKDQGIMAPSSLSLLFVAFSFIFAAIIHPQEFSCLPMGLIYYITIPSMYLFLVIYSVFNLNVVSWGTREVPKKLTAQEKELAEKEKAQEKLEKLKENTLKSKLISFLGGNSDSFTDFFGMFSTKENSTIKQLENINSKIDRIEEKLGTSVEKSNEEEKNNSSNRIDSKVNDEDDKTRRHTLNNINETPQLLFSEIPEDSNRPYWITDKCLGSGNIGRLKKTEIDFWTPFIEKYLKPLEKNVEKEKKDSLALKELRNQMVFSFLMINSIWVLTIFLLQKNKDRIYIEWPFGDHLKLEPIGFLFIFFFGLVLMIQLIGMIMHRIMTLGHVVSSTSIFETLKDLMGLLPEPSIEEVINKDGVQMIKKLQSTPRGDDNETSETDIEDKPKTFEQKVKKMLNNPNLKSSRRASELLMGGSNKFRSDTFNALSQRHHHEIQRRETLKQYRKSLNQDFLTNRNEITKKSARRVKISGTESEEHVQIHRTNTYEEDPKSKE